MRAMSARRGIAVAIGLAALGAVVAAQAKFSVKPGLWESTTTMEGMGPGETHKVCITPEKLASGAFDDTPSQECKHSVKTQTATTMDVTEACTSKDTPGMTGQATLHLEALSPTTAKGSIATTMSMSGRSMTMNGTFTSKWIAASCGDVK